MIPLSVAFANEEMENCFREIYLSLFFRRSPFPFNLFNVYYGNFNVRIKINNLNVDRYEIVVQMKLQCAVHNI